MRLPLLESWITERRRTWWRDEMWALGPLLLVWAAISAAAIGWALAMLLSVAEVDRRGRGIGRLGTLAVLAIVACFVLGAPLLRRVLHVAVQARRMRSALDPRSCARVLHALLTEPSACRLPDLARALPDVDVPQAARALLDVPGVVEVSGAEPGLGLTDDLRRELRAVLGGTGPEPHRLRPGRLAP
ncbi:MAG: hypothetical protein L0216_10175 [Planctomycetales bacterium]|nr:hypothetical protein [Planctomycetales bacterium]